MIGYHDRHAQTYIMGRNKFRNIELTSGIVSQSNNQHAYTHKDEFVKVGSRDLISPTFRCLRGWLGLQDTRFFGVAPSEFLGGYFASTASMEACSSPAPV